MSISNAALRNPTHDDSCEAFIPILSDRGFHILLERFCNQVSATQPAYESFLQQNFNDEGYVDIWRIPHVMMDVLMHRTRYNRVFDSAEFRKTFHQFIRELLVFCAKEVQGEALVEPFAAHTARRVLHNQGCGQESLNALMTSFSRIMENLGSDDESVFLACGEKETASVPSSVS